MDQRKNAEITTKNFDLIGLVLSDWVNDETFLNLSFLICNNETTGLDRTIGPFQRQHFELVSHRFKPSKPFCYHFVINLTFNFRSIYV